MRNAEIWGGISKMDSVMRITGFRRAKRRKNRFEVLLDGEPAAEVDAEVIVKLKLRRGMEVDDRLLAQIRHEDERLRARRAALRLLLLRPRSRKELFLSLAARGFNEAVVDDVLDELEAAGKIQEADFAARFVKDRVKLKHHGAHKIAAELRERGIDSATIEDALAQQYPPEKQFATALALLQKKFPNLRGTSAKEQRQISSFLYQRGFDEDTVYRVIEHFKD
jgi:regulatory protein